MIMAGIRRGCVTCTYIVFLGVHYFGQTSFKRKAVF